MLPGYWMHETSGILKPVIHRYLNREPLDASDYQIMRAYLKQWVSCGAWVCPADFAERIDGLTSYEALDNWLDDAIDLNMDHPL